MVLVKCAALDLSLPKTFSARTALLSSPRCLTATGFDLCGLENRRPSTFHGTIYMLAFIHAGTRQRAAGAGKVSGPGRCSDEVVDPRCPCVTDLVAVELVTTE